MLTPAMFRHELIRVIKVALPKDDQIELSRDMVEQVQAKLAAKLAAAWNTTYAARRPVVKRKKRRAE